MCRSHLARVLHSLHNPNLAPIANSLGDFAKLGVCDVMSHPSPP
ncbi:hypothetical protein [Nostoc sp. PCC 9305]